MDGRCLAVVVLHDLTEAAMQHTGRAEPQRRRMVAQGVPAASRFDAHQFDTRLVDQGVEHPRRVAASTNAGDHRLWRAAELSLALADRLAADHRLEIADNPREGIGADRRTEDVVGRLDTAHPVPHGRIDRVP